MRDLQPDDPPKWLLDRVRGEAEDVLAAGHFPHLPRLLQLIAQSSGLTLAAFPQHGVVAVETRDGGATWRELWRLNETIAFPR
jgi:phosphohistidine phosphatase SixA